MQECIWQLHEPVMCWRALSSSSACVHLFITQNWWNQTVVSSKKCAVSFQTRYKYIHIYQQFSISQAGTQLI